jgi:arginase
MSERKLRLIISSFDSGWRDARMGSGPLHLMTQGLPERLAAEGWEVVRAAVDVPGTFTTEIETGFALQREVAGQVAAACAAGEFPLVLAGNCNTAALGAVSGMPGERRAIVWLDGHGDFNTPEETETGFLDGMGLAMANGRCWRGMTARIPGFEPVPDERILLVGGQDLDPAERVALGRSGITHLPPEAFRGGVASALSGPLARLRAAADAAYLHVDLDIHGQEHGPANALAPPTGMAPAQVRELVERVGRALPVRAAALTAYDPSCDADGRTLGTALALAVTLLAAVAA